MDNHSIAAESFQTTVPLPKWNHVGANDKSSEKKGSDLDKSWNCFGVVHVHLLSAQRLPCPVGSSVSATVSLLPWRGKVRTSHTVAFSIAVEHGVCVAWDPTDNQGVCSMVHAWNSEDSPVPDIKIDLNFSPLGFGLFEFKMASLTLPCEVLLKSPYKWKRQWCQTEQDAAAKRDATGLGPILIQLEAIFIPGPANINNPLPDPNVLENRIGYVDKEENTAVSRMSDEDGTSIDSDINGIIDDSMMDTFEGQSTADVEDYFVNKAQHEETPDSIDSNSMETQRKKTPKPLCSDPESPQISAMIESDSIEKDQVSNQEEQLNLSEATTAAELLSYLIQTDQEQLDQEQVHSKAQTPISHPPPSKPSTTTPSRSQEGLNLVKSVAAPGPILDQEQVQLEQIDLPPQTRISDSKLSAPVSAAHNSSQNRKDLLQSATSTGPISDQEHIQQEQMDLSQHTPISDSKPSDPVSKQKGPGVTMSPSHNSSQISKQEKLEKATEPPIIFNREKGQQEQIHMSALVPTLDAKESKLVSKKKDPDQPRHMTTIEPIPTNSSGGKCHREDTDMSALLGISDAKQSTPVSKKKVPMLVTTTKSATKTPVPNKVQVDMSAVVKAGNSVAANSVASNNDAASVSMISTANNTMYSTLHSTHLLRTVNFWVPSYCAVCEKLLYGRKGGAQCEVCHIDCCLDCRLNVDVRIPCGPSHSKRKKASIESILSFVAPDEVFERNRKSLVEEVIDEGTVCNEEDLDFSTGIGYLKLCFLQAAIFKQSVSSDEHPEKVFAVSEKAKLLQGDYYARVSISASKRTGRTPTVQKSGIPQFRATRLFFGIEDYGREFRLDIVDSNTDSVVGSATLTTQGILQRQRDSVIEHEGASLFQFAKGPIKADGTLDLKVQLRSDAKGRRFASNEGSANKPSSGIVGWLEIEVGIEEYTEKLLSADFDCPKRVYPAFRMSNLQEQLKRINYLLDDAKSVLNGIKYIVSWKDPMISAAALYTHIVVCLRFNSEYGGSLPFVFIICWMLHARNRRFSIPTAGAEDTIVPKASDETENKGTSKDTTNRPIAFVTVDVTKGADLLSRDGIPGKTSCHVLWDPTKCLGKRQKAVMKKLDKASHSPFEIGHTDTRYTAQPNWILTDSQYNKRLKGLLPPDEFFDTIHKKDVSMALSFPVLQPLAIDARNAGGDNDNSDIKLTSWDKCPGGIVCQVYFSDVLLGLGVEYEIGEVVIPFADLVKKRRISGWFDVTSGVQDNVVSVSDEASDSKTQGMKPRIHITLSWQPPRDDQTISDETSQDLSIAIQEELSHFSHTKKANIIESSLGAVNTALGLGGNLQDVQNTVISVLDLVESVVNLFNFTDPFKSSLVFWAIVAVCVIFLVIPTRYIVLITGLGLFWITFDQQFGITKLKIFKKKAARVPKSIESFEMREEKGETGDIFVNALRSLPTREDLRKAVYWEKLRVDNVLAEKRESKKREVRLRKLWKSQWFSNVKLKEQSDKDPEFLWIPAFAVVQGHFFLWWEHAHDFDKGEQPAGKVYLSGHAGLTGPSPLEMRELLPDELPCFVGIFGRGEEGQERISILTENDQLKGSLEDAILHLEKKND